MSFRSIDPATGETLEEYEPTSADDARRRADKAMRAFEDWRRRSFDRRALVLERAATILRENADDHAVLMTREMGKPITQARSEVEKCAWVLEYYAKHGAGFLADERADTDAAKSYVAFRPLGIVLGIMPWNFPYWQFFRYAAPTLMAGNGTLLKHSSNVQGCAEAMVEVLHEAGAEDLVYNLRLDHDDVPGLLDHPGVRAVTLTGSVRAGREVAQAAGQRLLPSVMELGGSDAYLVLDDADLDHAVEQCATSRLINAGQSCIAAKRFVVVDAVHDAFVERIEARLRKAVVGDPRNEETNVGPMAREDLRDALHEQVEASIADGAERVCGGEIPDRPGAWYPVTLLTGVAPDSTAGREELFGPVASVIRAEDEEDAIRIANDSDFGLGAAVFTEDRERGERIARDELEAGACFVNAFVRSDPRLPFGGVKDSGYGRELARFGIREFVNAKAVWVD